MKILQAAWHSLYVCVCLCVCLCVCVCARARALGHFSHVQLCVTLWTATCQASLSMGFSRQGYWSGLPCSPSGDLPDPRNRTCISWVYLYWQTGSLPLAPPGKHTYIYTYIYIYSGVKKIIFIRRGWRGETGKRKEAKMVMSSDQIYVRISPSGLLWESVKSSPQGCPL